MKQVPLSEVAEFINGRAFKPEDWQTEGLPIIRIQNLTGSTDTVNYYSGKVEPRYLVRNDDILISWSASLGVYKWQGGDAILNQHIFKVELKEKLIDKEYFYYAAQNALVEMESHVHGATMQHITRDPFLAIEIPLPPLTEQKRIASLLARADRLRQMRRTAHDLGDALLQSVFLEMFGDMVRNDKGWKIMSLGQTCDEIYRYPTFYGFDYVEDGVPVVRIGDILMNGEVNPNLENYVRIAPEINKRFPRTILELGDILMAVRGDGSTGKRIGIVKSKNLVGSNISPNLLRFKAKEKYVSSSFLFTFMTSSGGQELIDRYITRTAKKTITSTDIQTIKIPVPPLSLQEAFAGVVARVESLRGRMGESTRQVEGLFESLLAQSFGGER